MIGCATLTKSPYCASHSTRSRGAAVEKPYSNPITAVSESGLL